MLLKDSNINVFTSLEEVKEAVLEMVCVIENKNFNLDNFGEFEEVVLLSSAYSLSSLLLKRLKFEFDGIEENVNGGWWFSVGKLEEDVVLRLTDGVVTNYFIFVKSIV